MNNFWAWFTLDHVTHLVLGIPVAASILHSALPPWDGYNEFPTFQKYYKAFIYTLGYVGINARSTFHPTISTNNGQQPSVAAINGSAQAPIVP